MFKSIRHLAAITTLGLLAACGGGGGGEDRNLVEKAQADTRFSISGRLPRAVALAAIGQVPEALDLLTDPSKEAPSGFAFRQLADKLESLGLEDVAARVRAAR